MTAAGLLVPALALLASSTPAGAPVEYAVDGAASELRIHVGKSGLFGFAGHRHEVLARGFSGTIAIVPGDWSASSVELSFPAAGLEVDAAREPAGDAPKVQAAMEKKVTEPGRFPLIRFRSTSVTEQPGGKEGTALRIEGVLELHGASQEVAALVELEQADAALTASGTSELRLSDFAIKPPSAAGGTVKASDRLKIRFRIQARAAASDPGDPAQ